MEQMVLIFVNLIVQLLQNDAGETGVYAPARG